MEKEQLIELRKKIVASAQEIALHGDGSAADRLQILLSLIRDGVGDTNVLSKAFELAQTLENPDDKLSTLLDLLYEVDAKITADEQSDTAGSGVHGDGE